MSSENWVQKFYAKRASLYERLFVDFLGWGRELETFFRRSGYIQPDFKILDAGCGTGIVTRILYRLAQERGFEGVRFHAFDLTQNMLDIFQQWIATHGADNIELKQADVLEAHAFPSSWREYDLIVSSTMLEYLPEDKIMDALINLERLLSNNGIFLAFLTKRNTLTQWLAEKWWRTNLFEESETQLRFYKAGFANIKFKNFSSRWSKFIIVIEAKK